MTSSPAAPPDWADGPTVRHLPPDVTPAAFWEAAVAPRQPVVVRGPLRDPRWRAQTAWTPDGLASSPAADVVVDVETRRSRRDRYGRGAPKRRMRFGDFVAAAAGGDDTLYLSADAPPAVGRHGAPAPLGDLALALAGDVPLAHPLAGGLILNALHVWMGAAPRGAASGLHADYHDNIYALAAGTKTFTLFPPALAPALQLHGRLVTIHPNGRLVFAGSEGVGPDGADAAAVAEDEAADGDADSDDADADSDDADLDAALASAAAGEGVDDDYEGSEGEADSDDGDGDGDDDTPPPRSPSPPPPSFSRLDLPADAARLPMACAATVTLTPGDTLYLPAGWFHNVVSTSAPGTLHAAASWWFHPPDAVASPATPYSRPYWGRVWEGVLRACPRVAAAWAADAERAGGGRKRKAETTA